MKPAVEYQGCVRGLTSHDEFINHPSKDRVIKNLISDQGCQSPTPQHQRFKRRKWGASQQEVKITGGQTMFPQWQTQYSHSPASASPRQPSPLSHRREEAGALACLTSVETKLHVMWKHSHKHRALAHQSELYDSLILFITFLTWMFAQNEFDVRTNKSFIPSLNGIFHPVPVLVGILGALVPCCLDLSLAHQYGECLCMPLLPGSTFAMRVGIRERYKIRVSVYSQAKAHLFCLLKHSWTQNVKGDKMFSVENQSLQEK